MILRLSIACVIASVGSARADHAHGVDKSGAASAFGAGVTMIAASYETMLYAGNYQGIVPAVKWSSDRFAAGANVALYRLDKNGGQFYGFGDVIAHGQAALIGAGRARAGVLAAVTIPTGDAQRGLSMGHPMVMPALFAMWSVDRVALAATAGYSRAIAEHDAHGHALWPLVEPMNLSELTWSAAGDVAITSGVVGGARMSGGVPFGEGVHRLVGALRAGWANRRFSTAAELQAGLLGDPFTLRGVVSTAVRF